MQKNIQNDEDDKMKTTDSSKVVNEMIKELISEDELSDIESTNETHKRKTNEDVVSHRRARRNKSKNRHTRKGKTKKTKKKNKKTNKKLNKVLKIIGITLAVLVVVLAIVYFGIAYIYYNNRFLNGTVINGYECSNMKVEEAYNNIDKDVNSFNLTISKGEDVLDVVKGSDIGINTGNTDNQMKEICDKQKKYLWLKYFREKQEPITTNDMVQYDEEKFNNCIANLKSMNMTPTVVSQDAKLDFSGSNYKIVAEVYGNEINKDTLKNLIMQNVQSLKPQNYSTKIDVATSDCYIKPNITKDNEKLVNACNKANSILNSTFAVKVINKVENIDSATVKSWVSVDKDFNVNVDETKIGNYVETLNSKYTTYGKDRKFKTTYGDVVTVSKGDYGRKLNATSLKTDLVSAVKNGKSSTVVTKFSRTAMGSFENDLGTTYAEIDLTNQRMWMYKDGKIVVATDVVTGKPDGEHDTPQGTYKLKYKEKNATLKGANYSTPVAWWMPFNGDIGMHDATWQPTFGGDRYIKHGSHGCVNLPLDKAASIFNYAVVNMPVVCYYHAKAENPSASNTSTETTTQTTTKAS